MGLDLSMTAGTDVLTRRLGADEASLLETLRSEHPADVEAVFGVPDFGQASLSSGKDIVAAARNLAAALQSGTARHPVTYYLEIEGPGGRKSTSGFGMQCDMAGAYYQFRVGRGRSEMRRLVRGPDGTNTVAEILPLQPGSTFRSDDGTTIRIRTRTDHKHFIKFLNEVVDFADRHPDEQVQTVIG